MSSYDLTKLKGTKRGPSVSFIKTLYEYSTRVIFVSSRILSPSSCEFGFQYMNCTKDTFGPLHLVMPSMGSEYGFGICTQMKTSREVPSLMRSLYLKKKNKLGLKELCLVLSTASPAFYFSCA